MRDIKTLREEKITLDNYTKEEFKAHVIYLNEEMNINSKEMQEFFNKTIALEKYEFANIIKELDDIYHYNVNYDESYDYEKKVMETSEKIFNKIMKKYEEGRNNNN